MTEYVYTLYHVESKSYVASSGYYGNETNVAGFPTKQKCDEHINMYYRHKGFIAKRLRIMEFRK